MKLTYVTGDATQPLGPKPCIIAHVCNDEGKWGKGFVLAVSKRWMAPQEEYKKWHRSMVNFELGAIQLVDVGDEIFVANMIGQHGIRPLAGTPPIRYDALQTCLIELSRAAQELDASIHMPKIGAGLAGGDWQKIEAMIEKTLCNAGLNVTIYELPHHQR